MDVGLEIINFAFFVPLLSWVLLKFWRRNRATENGDETHLRNGAVKEFKWLRTITIYSNAIISTLYLSFGCYGYWNYRIIRSKSVASAITWLLATVVTFCSENRNLFEEDKRWPSALVFWWVFSSLYLLASLCIYFLIHLKSIDFPNFLPRANAVDFAAFPLSIIVCFAALAIGCPRKNSEIERSLLQKEGSFSEDDSFTNAGILSKLTFQWLNPLFKRGRIQKLELSHIPPVPPSETAEDAFFLLEESLRRQKMESSSLPEALIHAIRKSLAVTAIFAGSNTIASYMGPFLITNFVDYLLEKSENSSMRYGFILAFIFFFAKTVESLAQRQLYLGTHRAGIRIKVALTVLIYKKSISINYAGPSSGKIVNFINVDVERIGDFCRYVHEIWLLPVQVLLALVILYWNLGAAPSFVALLATLFVMVCNTPLAGVQERMHSKIMEARDSRIKLTSEALKGMRVLKLHSWESTFLKKILELRKTERSWLKRYLYSCSAVAFLFWVSPTLVSVITFGTCIALKAPLTAGSVLSALATFRILQEPIYNLPELISMIAQTKVSVYRIQEFIRSEEDQKRLLHYPSRRQSDIAIDIETGEYSWDMTDLNLKKPAIKISEKIKIMKGYKVAVCGSVGSGKSSLLCSALGEIPRISGTAMKVYGTKAYVPQSAWIQSGTVRDNVLFGKDMNRLFYEDVLEACALNQDIKTWFNGDLTIVGERGMNLSGGQKQRIQLARAVYSDSDIYFLDDPFSAVDAHTGSHLFKRCLLQLLSEKTVIYATHQLEFIEAADLVLVMKNGRIVQTGKYTDLVADSESELARQISAHRNTLNHVNPCKEVSSCPQKPYCYSQIESAEERSGEPLENGEFSARNEEEEAQTGRVKWSVYSGYVTSAFGGALVPVILLCQVLFQALQMGSNYWIAWAAENAGKVSRERLIAIFVLLSGGSSIFIFGRALLLTTVAIETAQRLFLGMIRAVFQAPISFFDSTPSSRILNRSSTDQSTIDTDIPYRLAGLAFALIQLLSIIILMSHVAWQVFLLFVAVIAVSIWYQRYYITTAREIARMVGIRKTPIIHHFSESISGATTIRCFNQEDRFVTKMLNFIDDYSRVAFHNSTTMEWLCLRINFLFNVVFLFVLIVLVTLPRSAIDPSLAGLAATYGLNLNVLQAWVIWNLCNVENKMISVERVLQFTKLPTEAPLTIEDCRPNPDWPSNGRIEIENLHVQYNPSLPMILKGITCTFPGSKKIGIVGRTGSGKSTLIQALFRLVEPSDGRILIDGVDICKIGLPDLRTRLGIIPQDPTLFQGTIRTNVDPPRQHIDREIWEVLDKCRIGEMIRTNRNLLDAPVAEDGANWSVGQRQLLCLARVLLNKRRIIVLDEATASIDTATETVIRETLREETKGCTVITVAHRIHTVVENDFILVLDEGKVMEYDSPAGLLENENSSFSKLVDECSKRSSNKDSYRDRSWRRAEIKHKQDHSSSQSNSNSSQT